MVDFYILLPLETRMNILQLHVCIICLLTNWRCHNCATTHAMKVSAYFTELHVKIKYVVFPNKIFIRKHPSGKDAHWAYKRPQHKAAVKHYIPHGSSHCWLLECKKLPTRNLIRKLKRMNIIQLSEKVSNRWYDRMHCDFCAVFSNTAGVTVRA